MLLHHYVLRPGLCLSFPYHTCGTRYMDGFSSPLPLFQVFRSSLCMCVIVPSGSGSSRQIISRSGPFLSRYCALPGAVRPSVFHLSVRACSSEDRVRSDFLSLACGECMGFGSAEGCVFRHREQMHPFGFGPTPTPSRGLGITWVQHRAGPTLALLHLFSRVHLYFWKIDLPLWGTLPLLATQ